MFSFLLAVETCRVSAVPFNRQWPGHQRELSQTVEARYVQLEADGCERWIDVGDAQVSATLLPLSAADRLVARDGRWLLKIDIPADYVVDFGDAAPVVQVFVQPPWKYEPRPGDVRFGPGEHWIGRRVYSNSNVRVVLDRGAVVRGAFKFVGATNVSVVGRGTIDCAGKGDRGYGGPFGAHRCRNVTLAGVVLRNSAGFNVNVDDCDHVLIDGIKIVGAWRYNSDGIDICASRDTVVRNCYIRTYDDCVVARGCCPWVSDAPLSRMTVSNCVLWCDWGKNCEVWAGSRANVIEDVTFRGNRLIRCAGIPMDVTTWFGSSNTVIRNVLFEDQELDLEPCRLVLKMQAYDGEPYVPSYQKFCILGNVDCTGVGPENANEVDTAVDADVSKYHLDYSNIRFSDIRVLGTLQPLILRLVADERYHKMRNVTFDRLPAGTCIQREGPRGNDPVWQTDAVRNLSGRWAACAGGVEKEVMMPDVWTNRTVSLTVERASTNAVQAAFEGRPLKREIRPDGSASFELPPLVRGGKHTLTLSSSVFESGRTYGTLYPLLGRIELRAPAAGADERGTPVFGDTFDVVGTFAENWVSSRAENSDGVVKLPAGATLKWRGALPLEFVMEADVTLQPRWSTFVRGDKNGGWGGFGVDGAHFEIRDTGTAFMVYKPAGEKHSSGKYPKIKGYVKGLPNRLRLVRKVQGSSVKYAFSVNGETIGEYMTQMPEKKVEKKGGGGEARYEPVTIAGYNVDMEVDNFGLFQVRHDDDSPNMVYNSSFEYDEEGLPTHYNLFGRFPWGRRPNEEFETVFLKRWGVDTAEKHSGKQSLRATLSPSLAGDLVFNPWQVGVVKGQPGVFSLWAKTDIPGGVDIQLSYGSGKAIHKLDGEWRRFEVGCTNLPAKFVYSQASVRILKAAKLVGHVWFDDLQAEIVPMPEGGRFDPKKTYATKYLVSELDRSRFGERKLPALPPTVKVAKLPKGTKPTAALDAWKDAAAPVGPFWVCQAKPRRDTEAWAACDDDNLYLGFRNYGEDTSLLARPKHERDYTIGEIFARDSLEVFLKPVEDGESYHLFAASNGDIGDLYANSMKWNGTWDVAAQANTACGSVDYLLTIPFADIAPNGFSGKWTCNLGRNDRHGGDVSAGECQSTAKTVKLSYNQPEFWGAYELPADVAAKWIARAAEIKAEKAGGQPRILGRLDFYMNEPEAKFRVWNAKGKMTEHALDITKMPCGTNKVTVAGMKTEVVKLPYRKGATQVNRFSRSIIHDGKPVLFTGIFIGDNGFSQGHDEKKWDAILDLFQTYGFKYSHILTGPKRVCVDSTQYLINEGARRGIPFILWGKYGDKDFLVNKRNVPAAAVMDEAEMVAAFPFDNILSYMVMDEPELGCPSDTARDYLLHMKTYFPYTPCQMNNTVLGIPSRYADLKTDILMLDDYLTNNENRTVDSVVSQVDYMIAADPGKPCWYFIVGDNISLHYKFPNYAEQVAQSWGCLCAGSTGISWYIGIPGAMGSWRACVDVNREAQALAPVLLSEAVVPSVTATEGKKKLRHLTKKLGNDWYVLTCNVDRDPLEKVTFTLPKEAPQNGTVEVLFENRTLPLKDGVFTDAYAGHTRHLYKIVK